MSSLPPVLDPRVEQVLSVRDRFPLPLQQSGEPLSESQLFLDVPQAMLFAEARYPAEAYAGLLLLLRCWEQSHHLSQGLSSAEGSYWHALAHRTEPDLANANYWFRKVGRHSIFPPLHVFARTVLEKAPVSGWRLKDAWDPGLFGSWCEEARSAKGSAKEAAAIRIQQEEWNLLFFWCAGVASSK